MENNKKEKPETSRFGYTSLPNNLPSDLGEAIKVFKKSLEGLENMVKLLKSDINKPLPFDISNPLTKDCHETNRDLM